MKCRADGKAAAVDYGAQGRGGPRLGSRLRARRHRQWAALGSAAPRLRAVVTQAHGSGCWGSGQWRRASSGHESSRQGAALAAEKQGGNYGAGQTQGTTQRWCERNGMEMRGRGGPLYKSVWVTERSPGSPRVIGCQISL